MSYHNTIVIAHETHRDRGDFFSIIPLFYHSQLFMTKKIRITWVQVMALLALFGILLGVVGTAWLALMPVPSNDIVEPNISAEVNL